MSQHTIEDMETYARRLKEHPAEVHTLFKEMLINVTSFFRDPEAFAALKHDILPQLFAGKTEVYCVPCLGGRLRHRRGGLFHRDAAARTHGRDSPGVQGAELYNTDLEGIFKSLLS